MQEQDFFGKRREDGGADQGQESEESIISLIKMEKSASVVPA